MEVNTFNFITPSGYKNQLTPPSDQHDLAGARNLIKMSLSVQRSIVESFEFNDKKVQSVHVNGEESLVSRDVYM